MQRCGFYTGRCRKGDRQLADEIGHRLTGSANYAKPTGWVVAELIA
jgi:hypothetical protein